MPRFAANLTMLYGELDFLDRFAAAAGDGFTGVEFPFPYPYPKEELAERLRRHGLVQVLHNPPAGDWAAGERGIACYPDQAGEFQDGVGLAIDYATSTKGACCQARETRRGRAAGRTRGAPGRGDAGARRSFRSGKIKDGPDQCLIRDQNNR